MAESNFVLATIARIDSPRAVLPDEAGGEEGETAPALGQIDEHIVRRTAGALGLAANIGELFGLGIDVDQLDLVDNPIAAGQQASMALYAFGFHGG